jgi:cytochrome P450
MDTTSVESRAGGCPVAHGGAALPKDASLTDPQILAHPNAFYEAMRKQDPVHYDSKLGMWLVSRYDDIVEVLRDPITYSDKHGYAAQYASGFFEEFKQILERDGGGFFPDVIKDDPPAHTRVRKLMDKAFTAHRVATLEPAITKVIVDLIEKLADKAAGVRNPVDHFGDLRAARHQPVQRREDPALVGGGDGADRAHAEP